MRLDILTLFPNMMSMFFEESILSRAQKKGIVEVVFHDLHDYSLSRYGSVDDYPYGGGAGMVMAVEPLANCIEELKGQRSYDEIIYTAPDGEMLSQPMANTLSLKENLVILCGHYKGVDERIREHFINIRSRIQHDRITHKYNPIQVYLCGITRSSVIRFIVIMTCRFSLRQWKVLLMKTTMRFLLITK